MRKPGLVCAKHDRTLQPNSMRRVANFNVLLPEYSLAHRLSREMSCDAAKAWRLHSLCANEAEGREPEPEEAILPRADVVDQCDQREPSCSHCSKHNFICEKQTFKPWTPVKLVRAEARNANKRGNASPARTLDTVSFSSQDERVSNHVRHFSRCRSRSREPAVDDVESLNPGESYVSGQSFTSTTRGNLSHSAAVDSAVNLELSKLSTVRQHLLHGTPCPSPLLLPHWPDMADSAGRRFLWDYFTHSIHDRFLCFDNHHASSHGRQQNPFATVLPQMAAHNVALRSTILYFSANAYEKSHGRNRLRLASETLLGEAVEPLLSLGTQINHVGNIIIVIVAGVLLYLAQPNDGGNFLNLAQSAAAYLKDTSANPLNSHHPFYQLAMAMLRWAQISSSCFLPYYRTSINQHHIENAELQEHGLDLNCFYGFKDWISDPILAFSASLVNPLLRLGRLLQLQATNSNFQSTDLTEPLNQVRCSEPDGEVQSQIERDSLRLEEDLLKALDFFRTASQSNPADTTPLLRYNESMHISALLLFYARIRHLPFTHPVVRRYVRQTLNLISEIPSNSCVSRAVLFPLAVSGCEAVSENDRDVVLTLLKSHNGVMSIYNLAPCLQQLWTARDLHPSLIWPEWMDKGTISARPFT